MTLLCRRAAALALQEAGWGSGDERRERCGVFLGNAYGAYEANLEHQRKLLSEGGRAVSPAVFTLTLPNVAAGWISIMEQLKGPLASFASGCLAPAEAIVRAAREILSGAPGPCLAGGAHAFHPDVHSAILASRPQGKLMPVSEAASFVILAAARPGPGSVVITGAATARKRESEDPLASAIEAAGAAQSPGMAALAAGDAGSDPETAARLKRAGFDVRATIADLFGDLGEVAGAVGACTAVRWLRESAAAPGPGGRPGSVLVAGLDACSARAFALRLEAHS